jgi:4-diphosphocytidyl-2C-methyl-D-erythritol kinase
MLVVVVVEQVETRHHQLEMVVLVVDHQDQVELIQHQTQLIPLAVEVEGQVLFNMQQLPATLREATVVPE